MQRRTAVLVLSLCAFLGGCSGPTAPSETSVVAPAPPAAAPAAPTGVGIAVAGKVYDTGNRELAGAVIEVMDGASAGKTATTDGTGQFAIIGDFDENTRFRAAKAGHADGIVKLSPSCAACHPNFWIYFNLAVPESPAAIAGDYTLTITADPAACAGLPEHAKQRSYSVHIAPAPIQPTSQNTAFTATIDGGHFTGRPYDGIWFAVAGDYLEFWMGDEHGDPGLVDQTAGDSYYSVGAWGHTMLGAGGTATIASTFEGQVTHCVLQPGVPLLDASGRFTCGIERSLTRTICGSTKHQLLLTRR